MSLTGSGRRKRLPDGRIPTRRPRVARHRFGLPSVVASDSLKVRSGLERRCVEYFENRNIRYQYEPLILLGGRQFRPDFFLPDYGLFIEICGYLHMPHYRDRQTHKEKLYQQHGLKAAFIRADSPKIMIEKLNELLSS